jgi:trehalose 6-phosphate synthase
MAGDGRRLIVVSNRGPVVHGRDAEGNVVARRGGGGLVTALDSLAADHEVTWIASALSEDDRAIAAEAGGSVEEQSRSGSPFHLRLVAHDAREYDRYYNVVANPMLWFIQHRLWDLARSPSIDGRFVEAWTDGYEKVNRGFAEAVLDELEASNDAVVFFHDYHLYLAPGLVRAAAPAARLAHFVHIPWVGAGGWSVLPLPMRQAIHAGLLANDVVGFHSHRWRRAFADACVSVLGATVDGTDVTYGERRTATVARPISVDAGEFVAFATSEEVAQRREELRVDQHESIIVRVDRTDPSKNILRGLEAFELLLHRHPEHAGRVRMVALLDPSRQDIPEYSTYREEIELLARSINERAGTDVVALRIEDDFPLSVAAYAEYDVLLVNPIADGLNLVAKEGPLVNARDGVLVLSEGAGSADELGPWALIVNPFDIGEQADALHRALTMPPDERRSRLDGIRTAVRSQPIAAWADALLDDLDRSAPVGRG